MLLLSDAKNLGNVITVIALCVAITVFLLVDVILVLSLHKSNNRLARKRGLPAAEEKTEAENAEQRPPASE